MAGEVKIVASMSVINSNFVLPKYGGQTQSIDQAAAGGGSPGIVNIGTVEEDIAFGDVTTEGWCFIKNLDNTNFVEFGPKNAGATMQDWAKLKKGEECVFRFKPGITMRAIADTAAADLQIILLED